MYVCVCIHACMHIYIHISTKWWRTMNRTGRYGISHIPHTYIHTYIHTYTRILKQEFWLSQSAPHIHTYIHTRRFWNRNFDWVNQLYAYIHTYIHTRRFWNRNFDWVNQLYACRYERRRLYTKGIHTYIHAYIHVQMCVNGMCLCSVFDAYIHVQMCVNGMCLCRVFVCFECTCRCCKTPHQRHRYMCTCRYIHVYMSTYKHV
jgi:hypothetical protein